MKIMKSVAKLSILTVTFFSITSYAFADSIDGQWCFENKNLSIDGSNIVIPNGKSIVGEYGRHSYSYVIPDGEPGTGSKIDMTLVDEDTLSLNRPAASTNKSKNEVWKRCEVTS